MSLANRLYAALLCTSLIWMTGCVGPMACGPGGACGPIAFGNGCSGGCGSNSCSGNGCGELYIDPWINHPADVCDPCDCCGNFNGQSCGKCRSVFDGIPTLWGYRCDDGCGDCGSSACDGGCGPLLGRICGDSCGGCDSCCGDTCGGCDSCAVGCDSCGGLCEGGVCANDSMVHIEHGSSEGKHIVRATEPYKPHRTRKIFSPKQVFSPTVARRPQRAQHSPGNSGQAITITR